MIVNNILGKNKKKLAKKFKSQQKNTKLLIKKDQKQKFRPKKSFFMNKG